MKNKTRSIIDEYYLNASIKAQYLEKDKIENYYVRRNQIDIAAGYTYSTGVSLIHFAMFCTIFFV